MSAAEVAAIQRVIIVSPSWDEDRKACARRA
jgi:hypothetical protein